MSLSHKGDKNNEKLLSIRYGDYEFRVSHSCLLDSNERTPELVHWVMGSEGVFAGEEYCYTILSWDYNEHEDWWELRFVGNRPFEEQIKNKEDLLKLWDLMGSFDKYLNDY